MQPLLEFVNLEIKFGQEGDVLVAEYQRENGGVKFLLAKVLQGEFSAGTKFCCL